MIRREPLLSSPGLPLSPSELAPLIERVLVALGLSGRRLSVEVVGEAAIEALNRDYLGLPGPTNVLSFPLADPDDPDYLGDLAICAPVAAREAFLYGQEPGEHFRRMLCHGILHLAGFDHGPDMDEAVERAVAACR